MSDVWNEIDEGGGDLETLEIVGGNSGGERIEEISQRVREALSGKPQVMRNPTRVEVDEKLAN